MKYVDAGNSSATPDTLIPPKFVQKVILFPANPIMKDLKWRNGYTYVRTDNTLNAVIAIKVESSTGAKYYSYKTPNMILPAYVLLQYWDPEKQ